MTKKSNNNFYIFKINDYIFTTNRIFQMFEELKII
jgi:hypothetical protein